MMPASIQLQPPQPFEFKKPDEWEKWKRRFQQFLAASGLEGKGDERKVNTLLYCLGEEAEGVLSSTGISDEACKKYDVLGQFDKHFKVRGNVIYERARFNKHDQREGESAEEYIAALYQLVETCEYRTFRDDLLRDHLVIGIRDTALSDKMQLDATLTLETAKKSIRQKEAVQEHRVELSARREHLVEDVTRRTASYSQRRRRSAPAKPRTAPAAPQSSNKCSRCGRGPHQGKEKCPAKNVICHRCKKKGHFCHSKVTAAAIEVQTLDGAFLGTLSTKGVSTWKSTVKVNGVEIQFKLDTGA